MKHLFNKSKEGRTEGGKKEVDKKKRKGGRRGDQMAYVSKVERIRKIKDGTSMNKKKKWQHLLFRKQFIFIQGLL